MNIIRLLLLAMLLAAILAGCSSPATTEPGSSAISTSSVTPPPTTQTTSATPAATTQTTSTKSTVPDTEITPGITATRKTVPPGRTVIINSIVYKGTPSLDESDEYVEIQNWHTDPIDMTGWVLTNANHESATFTFPSFTIEPTQTIRVYTNEVHPEWGGFSFGSETPIWDNDESNTAVLHDADGQLIFERHY